MLRFLVLTSLAALGKMFSDLLLHPDTRTDYLWHQLFFCFVWFPAVLSAGRADAWAQVPGGRQCWGESCWRRGGPAQLLALAGTEALVCAQSRDSPPQIDNKMTLLSVCFQEINVNSMFSVVAFMFQNYKLTTRTGKTLKTSWIYVYLCRVACIGRIVFSPDLSHNYLPFPHYLSLAELNKFEMVWNSFNNITYKIEFIFHHVQLT